MLSCIYVFINYVSISMQSGLSIGIQYLIGIMAVLLILEGCLYSRDGIANFSHHLYFICLFWWLYPRIWGHRGLSIERIFGFLLSFTEDERVYL